MRTNGILWRERELIVAPCVSMAILAFFATFIDTDGIENTGNYVGKGEQDQEIH